MIPKATKPTVAGSGMVAPPPAGGSCKTPEATKRWPEEPVSFDESSRTGVAPATNEDAGFKHKACEARASATKFNERPAESAEAMLVDGVYEYPLNDGPV